MHRRRRAGRPRGAAARRGRGGGAHRRQRRRARRPAPLDRPRAGPGRARAVARRPLRHRPAITDGFYYDFALPGGATFSDDDLERIDAAMRAIMAEDQPFVRQEHSIDEGLALFADQPFKREIIEGVAGASPDAELSAEASADIAPDAAAVTRTVLGNDRRLRRPVPRPPRALDRRGSGTSSCCGWPAPTGAATRTAPSCNASTAPPGSRTRPWPSTSTGWRRPSAATTAASGPSSTCSRSPPRSARGWPSSIPRAGSSAGSWRTTRASATTRAATSSSTRRTSPSPSCSRSRATWSGSPRACSRPWSSTRASAYYLKPMNCPFHILIYRSRQRSYRELPMRLFEFGTVYRYEKSGVVHGLTRVRGMTQDDSHIFCTREQMARRARLAAHLRARPPARLRPGRLLPGALDQARRQGGRQRRGVGRGHRGAAGGGRGRRPRARHGRGRAVRSTAPRSRCRPATPSAGTGRCPPSSSTSRPRSASGSSTSAPTTPGTARS